MSKPRGLSEPGEIARRIVREVKDALPIARRDLRFDVPFAHHVSDLRLPRRRITEAEIAAARKSLEAEPEFQIELHVIRLGDIAIAANSFELFLDYGLQITGRSPAEQTFVLQLTGAWGAYLPTREAVEGRLQRGHRVEPRRPAGGRVLIDETVKRIDGLWR